VSGLIGMVDHAAQALAAHRGGRRHAGVIADGRQHVERRDQVLPVDPAGGRDALEGHDQRHGRLFFVEHHLPGPAVRGQPLAVIAGEDDERAVLLPGLAQGRQHLPDLLVHVLDHAEVRVAVTAPVVLVPRFVAGAAEGRLADARRPAEVGRQRRQRRARLRLVLLPHLLQKRAGLAGQQADVVRVDERHHQQERLVAPSLEEVDSGVHRRLIHVVRQLVAPRGLVEHLEPGDPVARVGIRHVPLAGVTRVVSRGPKDLTRDRNAGIDRHAVAIHADLVRRAPRVQAGARGAAQRIGAVGSGEIDPLGRDRVHVGGLEPLVADRAGRIDPLLVRGDDQHVGPLVGLGRHQRPAERQRTQAEHSRLE